MRNFQDRRLQTTRVVKSLHGRPLVDSHTLTKRVMRLEENVGVEAAPRNDVTASDNVSKVLFGHNDAVVLDMVQRFPIRDSYMPDSTKAVCSSSFSMQRTWNNILSTNMELDHREHRTDQYRSSQTLAHPGVISAKQPLPGEGN